MDSPGYAGIPEPPASGFSAAAPPPPPPPPAPGQVPALRISTASEGAPRRPQLNAGPADPYEPPAAIQNAMMTKDKKPFTYTPGMGGKLDLSQIRSPRMARRVAKNANDEGIEGPPKSSLAQEPPRTPSTPVQPNIYASPQVAVPVFPQGNPQPAAQLRNSTLPRSTPVIERIENPTPRPTVKVETKMQPVFNSPDAQQTPTPPMSPTQVTLSKAPTPWMQKQVKQPEELPEWAKRSNNRSQDSSSSGSDSPQQQQPPQLPRQIVVVSSPRQAPTAQMRPVYQENNRVPPPPIEARPSVFAAMNEPGQHHQLMNTNPHHMSRWGNPVGQSGAAPVQQGGTYIIPVQVDGQSPNIVTSPTNANNYNPMQFNQTNRNGPRPYVPMSPQPEPGPVQSKSFRVLQKITDTDSDQVDGEQLRKLQLTEDDRCLMNKFKEQVDGDTYLHQEEDPRYRGAAIPSRAFRYLQSMTDSGDVSNANATPRTVNSAVKKQNRNSRTFDEPSQQLPQAHIPPSEQQAPEPKKYMGGAIPSRSFRILQAMTAPESVATQVMQENLQDSAADYVIVPGNQQGVYYPTYPHSGPIPTPPPVFWNPEIGWWAYYPYGYEQHPYLTPCYYYHPEQFCGIDTDGSLMTMTQLPPDESNVINNVSDECCTSPFRGNPLSRNSALYVGSQWSYEESSTSPTSCTTTTTTSPEQSSDRLMPVEDENTGEEEQLQQEQVIAASSTLSSLPSETEDSESEDEDIHNDDSSSCSSSKPNNDEENASAESSIDSSSSDSDSYLAYSTGLNPLRTDMVSQEIVEEEQEAEKSDVQDTDDATDCEKESILEDDENADDDDDDDEEIITDNEEHNDEDEKTYQESVQDDIDSTTVSVSLPLRIKFSVSEHDEDVTTVIVGDSTLTKDIDTCVDFTLKRPSILEPLEKEEIEETDIEETIHIKPRFVVTATDDEEQTEVSEEVIPEEINEDDIVEMGTSLEEKRKTLLSVQQSHSREEVTDDEDSGVTSDMSRIISEVDTDSECCMTTAPTTPITPTMPMPSFMPITPTTVVTSPVVKRANQNKYQRTQTHSRLFRLLSDEQMKLPTINNGSEEHSSNSSGITSPDCTLTDQSADVLASARHQLPTRPKSLDCEALFKKQQQSTDPQDPYYQTWKNGERRRSAAISPSNAVQWTVPKARVTVACPRVRSAKNVPQTLALRNSYYQYQSRTKPSSPLGSTTILSPSYIPHPVRTNDNRRC